MERSKFFEAFMAQERREKKRIKSKNYPFFFILMEDEKGLYVKTVNRELKTRTVHVENYSGILAQAVELYNRTKLRVRNIVDWDNPGFNIYLHRFPELFKLLTLCENLVDKQGKRVYVVDAYTNAELHISQGNNSFVCTLVVGGHSIDRTVSDTCLKSGNHLLLIDSIGESYHKLMELDTSIRREEITMYLSLLYSNFYNIDVKYKGYSVVESGECDLDPSIIVESIDESGFLTINTSYSYRGILTPEFYSSYRPSIVITLDDELCEIQKYVLKTPDSDPLDRLVSLLFKLEKKYELEDNFHIEDYGVLINPLLANILFGSELRTISDQFSIYGEKFLKKKSLVRCNPNLELKLQSAIDFLQGSAFLKVYGENLPLYETITEFQTSGYITLSDGTKGLLDRGYIEKLKRVIRETRDGVEISFFDLPYIVQELDCRLNSQDLELRLKNYLQGVQEHIQIDLSSFNGELRPYQDDGVRWLLNLYTAGVAPCLADDMGLGKTVQTLAFLIQVQRYREGKPILIVVPKSLIFNWSKEIEKFTSEFNTYHYYGPNRDVEQLVHHDIILTTYHTLRNDIEELKNYEFFITIADEIQMIKNHTSGLAKAICLISSQYRMGISGTPVENALSDLYSISRFLNPGLFGTFKEFKEQWSGPIYSEESEVVTNILRKKIEPLFLRRTKESVLDELPPKSEQILYVEMSEKQKSLYEHVRKGYHDRIRLKIREEGLDKSQLMIIKAFMELRQIATIPEKQSNETIPSPKIDFLVEQIIETISNGHKVLIFSNFLYVVSRVAKALEVEGIITRTITGATNHREQIVDDFMEDESVSALIMTLKTGGVGLNLTAASYVYIVDPWWNIAAENQAIDRTHRIGQKSAVNCYRLITRGSIEEKILELQAKKRDLFNNLFSAKEGEIKDLGYEDVEYLLS